MLCTKLENVRAVLRILNRAFLSSKYLVLLPQHRREVDLGYQIRDPIHSTQSHHLVVCDVAVLARTVS